MTKNKLLKCLLVLLIVFSTFFIPPVIFKTNAQTDTQTTTGISVSPVRVQKNFKGNDKDVIKFTVLNNEDTERTLSVTVKSFKLLNNNQDISFEPSVSETILNWIRNFKNSIILAPKEKKDYELELNITADTEPGGYTFGVFFETQGKNLDKVDSGAYIRQSIGVPIIVNIAGVEGITYGQVTLDTFDVSYNILSNNVHFNLVVLNNSNQIVTPTGLFTLTKTYGLGPDSLTSTFNTQARVVSSFSLRTYDKDIFFNQFALGKYNAKVDFLYGLENNVYTQQTDIWVIPIWAIVAVIIAVGYILRKIIRRNDQNDEYDENQ